MTIDDKKTFNLFCDESSHLPYDGMRYMLIGYVQVGSNDVKRYKAELRHIRSTHRKKGETKWSKVSESAFPLYEELLKFFFDSSMCFRAVIIDKSQIDETRPGFTHDDFYFRMYYQLLHHKMNLSYIYNVYCDIKDTRSHRKLARLKEMLHWNAAIKNFQFMRSHESSFMQLTDLIIGAINYALRGRGNVEAKNRLVDIIETMCNGPINHSTPKSEDKFNLFFIDLK
ncbi:DUF3800 domain-containing protein [Dyadobacter jiangsuensis]|uniref:Uncharacterized protein DUF3800 n=1 Tax=Dyadobacter jiangsuensis TaxID=1591085 RepID=A0A2P8FQ06_9BACT|nr:DUF3800 domain-containing protein [Dyadobacter jiangsuensis]PSL23810.1 uncharacterized protein DUF3800 [Dyadobacter jiangsuensis]